MKKVENSDFYKDVNSGAIVNSNEKDYLNCKSRRANQKMKAQKIKNLENELAEMKEQMKALMEKVNGNS